MPTLPAFIRDALEKPRAEAVLERVDAKWVPTSSTRLLERIENVALAIREAGLYSGDRIALCAQNRVDWIVADLGILFAGCVCVPIFPTQALDQVAFILENSEAKLVFADTQERAANLRAVPNAPPVVVFDAQGEGSLANFEAHGAQLRLDRPQRLASYDAQIAPKDMAVLIYTSGSTGRPKGVMLSHDNITANVLNSYDWAFSTIEGDDPVLSMLPFSHIYEHTVMYTYLWVGASMHICPAPEALLADMREVRPAVMSCVPRIFERLLHGMVARAKAEGGVRAKLVPWALAVGREYMKGTLFGPPPPLALRLQYAVAHALVLKKIRGLLGLDRLKFFGCGSAPLHIDTALTLASADIIITEGYGPTECSPVVTVNRLADNRYGTVGKPIANTLVKLAPDGEILVKGPSVMIGYYKDPAATASAFEDGWYKTGDVGEFDPDGYLRITDRKREIFKSSGGKFIAPARIESALKRSQYIGQVMIVGDGRSHPAALIAPVWDTVRRDFDIPPEVPTESIAKRDDVVALIRQEVVEHTRELATFEQVRKVALFPRDLTIEDGELSPTLKVRRRVVEERYAPLIEEVYAPTTAR